MENNEKKNHSLIDLMDASMSKIREMVDSNNIIGEPTCRYNIQVLENSCKRDC